MGQEKTGPYAPKWSYTICAEVLSLLHPSSRGQVNERGYAEQG